LQQIISLDISVIIVNYKVPYFLEQCLASLTPALEGLQSEVIVIDNNSEDISRDYLEPKFPWVNFIWEKNNHGFSRANNIGLKLAKGNHILFLNPDTIIPEHAIRSCIQKFNADKSFGAIGVKMISGNGAYLPESKRGLPSPKASFFKMTGITKLFPRSEFFSGYYLGHLDINKTAVVDVLAGAFMMLSRKAAEETKGFDEDFFMYGEDIDLSFRIQRSGLKNLYFPDVTIIHFKGESTQRSSASYNKHFYGAMKLFLKKHYPANFASSLISMGISISGLFRRRYRPKAKNTTNLNTAVVAHQSQFDRLIQLIKYAEPSLKIVRRIDPSKELLMQIKQSDNVSRVIFSGESVENQTIISQLQELPRNIIYYFHGKNTSSIVGSPAKNYPGDVIVKKDAASIAN